MLLCMGAVSRGVCAMRRRVLFRFMRWGISRVCLVGRFYCWFGSASSGFQI